MTCTVVEEVNARVKALDAETAEELAPLVREMAAREELRKDRDSYITNLTSRMRELEAQSASLNKGNTQNALAEVRVFSLPSLSHTPSPPPALHTFLTHRLCSPTRSPDLRRR